MFVGAREMQRNLQRNERMEHQVCERREGKMKEETETNFARKEIQGQEGFTEI